jgi:hypothetical protein
LTPIDDTRAKTNKELRSFGLSVGAVFGVLGALGFWSDSYEIGAGRWTLFALAAALILPGALAPRALALPYRLWMAIAGVMNRVMTILLLTVFFVVIITPIGLVQRLFSKKGLHEPPKPPGESYWRLPDPDPRGKERYEQPF